MRNVTANGAGTLLPDAKQVKTEKSPSKRKAGRPGKAARTPTEPETVTVAVTMPLGLFRRILAMGAHDRDASVHETIAVSMAGDVRAWLESGPVAAEEGKPNPQTFLRKFERELDAGLHPDVYPPPLVVQLDREAARLVRWVHADDPDYTLADVVNGAVRFNHGEETGMCTGDGCLDEARAARLGKESA